MHNIFGEINTTPTLNQSNNIFGEAKGPSSISTSPIQNIPSSSIVSQPPSSDGFLKTTKNIGLGILHGAEQLGESLIHPFTHPSPVEQQVEQKLIKPFPETKFGKVGNIASLPSNLLKKGFIRFFEPMLEPIGTDIAQIEAAKELSKQVSQGRVPSNVLNDINVLHKTNPQIVGDVAQGVLSFYTPSIAGGILGKQVSIGSKVVSGISRGAFTGGLFGLSAGLSSEPGVQKPLNIIKSTGSGIIAGGILGGTTGLLGGILDKIRNVKEQIQTPEVQQSLSQIENQIVDQHRAASLAEQYQTPEDTLSAIREGQTDLGTQGGFISSSQISDDIKNYLNKTSRETQHASDIKGDIIRLEGTNHANDIRAMQLVNKAFGTDSSSWEKIYNFDDGEKIDLTFQEKELYNSVIKPLKNQNAKMIDELRGNEIPIDPNEYAGRISLNRNSLIDRLQSGAKSLLQGGPLTKTAGASKRRVMMAIEDKEGNRYVVSTKGGRVVKWKDGKSEFLGTLRLKTQEDLMNKELSTLQSKLSNSQKELRLLTSSKSRAEASNIRIANLKDNIVKITNDIANIENKYSIGSLDNKSFIATQGELKGTSFKLVQAKTKEIEGNTDLLYSHNALANYALKNAELNRAIQSNRFLESFKQDPEFSNIAVKIGEQGVTVPDNWRTTQLPQFRGYAFEPKVAATLNQLYGRMNRGENVIPILSTTNRILKNAIFVNPLLHVPNATGYWFTARGIKDFLIPSEYKDLGVTTKQAWDAVTTMNEDYLTALELGAPLQTANRSGQMLHDTLVEKTGIELKNNPSAQDAFRQALGVRNPISWWEKNVSHKITWTSNDIMVMQLIYEKMNHGSTLDQAIADVNSSFLTYRFPSTVAGSERLSNILQNPDVAMFAPYHWDRFRILKNQIQGLATGKGIPRSQALNQLLALGVLSLVIYPLADKALKITTGNPLASFRRFGPTTLPEEAYKLPTQKEDIGTAIQKSFTPSIATKEAIQQTVGLDFLTGKKIDTTKKRGEHLLQAIPYIGELSKIGQQKETPTQFGGRLLGISLPKTTKSVIDFQRMAFDEKTTLNSRVKSLYDKGKQKEANDLIADFNSRLYKKSIQVLKENGYQVPNEENLDQLLYSYYLKPPTQETLQRFHQRQQLLPVERLFSK